ncbi:hypothetical protein ABFS82_11G006200 [Erythranthe guttata]|uniref:Ubiquitin thioesterase OTU n=1 Tax=Erythranthe guttata TaxID=4155 RepID=A0A022PWG3_ERYGU|nr:PREDICTED: OTU domain-containing protein At3g57810-like [Erythranthe guttata]EYU20717.1 hypothetical protein MIMGU_mgv1a011208mg [Erythranthe guttata]|eukprot:XP_012857366.1 PREDICTED: OTU domain-containing protein At3g57810-like [Erythranthe guttata]
MTIYSPLTKNVVCSIGNLQKPTIIRVFTTKANYCCPISVFQSFQRNYSGYGTAVRSPSCRSLAFKKIVSPKQTETSRCNNIGPFSWQQRGLSGGLFIGLFVCFSTSQPSYADVSGGDEKKERSCDDDSSADFSRKKNVLTDYSVIGIPGDGRCLFRSVAHGACVQSGKPAPNENLQRELADEIRARVADEFIKRREETEWFIEGDFETYVSQIRKPHVWGGEPELLMASHVLQMPITVYMHDKDYGGLISIAEYGQEYDKHNPIKVLYHGYGHYDALHIPCKGDPRPRL